MPAQSMQSSTQMSLDQADGLKIRPERNIWSFGPFNCHLVAYSSIFALERPHSHLCGIRLDSYGLPQPIIANHQEQIHHFFSHAESLQVSASPPE